MTDYANSVIAALAAENIDAAIDSTGGACECIAFEAGHIYEISDGHAGLPDGEAEEGIVATVSRYDLDGNEAGFIDISATDAPSAEDVARIAAQWALALN